MFARARLVPGRPEYASSYRLRPRNQESDDAMRANPGLLSAHGALADRVLFAVPKASLSVTEALRGSVDGPVSAPVAGLEPAWLTLFLKDLARYFGALEVGVAALQPRHVYSHVGRSSGTYGEPISIDHTHAIVFTVEMDFSMLSTGPAAPTVMESARQYVESARVAVRLAAAIRNLGFPARAHIDGDYRVVAPLVARDAGLGEIGRIGLLMTRRLGPRVRLGVVTTTAPLLPDPPTRRASVLDFCSVCRKCGECCPAKAIPLGDPEDAGGGSRWRLDAEACYRYWTVVGTDCGRCVAVCPYSHPDHPAHNLVRWGIERSGLFRRAASRMDDTFYGRKPRPKASPSWIRVASGAQPSGAPAPGR